MLNIVISLVFVYLLYSLFATILMEVISSVFALRAYNLRKALRTMLTNGEQNYYDEYLAKDSLFKQLSGKLNGKSSPPSYLNPKNFSLMMMNVLERSSNGMSLVEDQIESLPNGEMKDVLKMYFEEAESNIDRFKGNMESWFNDIMDRASGWFKRSIQMILIVVGFGIAVTFNVDSIGVFSQLQNAEIANSVAENASNFVSNNPDIDGFTLDQLNVELASVSDFSLGLGWDEVLNENGDRYYKNLGFKGWFLMILGWIVTALAISLGAPFWFDMLNKLVNVRGTGSAQGVVVNNKIQAPAYQGQIESNHHQIEG